MFWLVALCSSSSLGKQETISAMQGSVGMSVRVKVFLTRHAYAQHHVPPAGPCQLLNNEGKGEVEGTPGIYIYIFLYIKCPLYYVF